MLNAMEDRTTPTTVNATAISDAIESGTDGIIRVSRDVATTDPLDVEFTVGGTATADTDYQALTTSVTIPAGDSSVDVHVIPIWNTVNDTGSRTVSIDITATMDYDAGTSATSSIQDDVDPRPVVVNQSTFQLSGSAGSVNVSLTVTYTAPTVLSDPGTYTWQYQLQNPTTATTTWTTFAIPVSADPDTSDVGNLTGPSGWTGTVGSDNVSWTTSSGGLAPGDIGTFSFTTAPRYVDGADVYVSDGSSNVADLPTAPAPRQMAREPQVNITFHAGTEVKGQAYTINLTMEVADGSRYQTGPQVIATETPNGARDILWTFLNNNGWEVAKGDSVLMILGKRDSSGKIIGIKELTYSVTAGPNGGFQNPPTFGKAGQVDLIEQVN